MERVIYSQHPLRAEYRLTEDGQTLAPVIEEIVRWGLDHCFEGEPEARTAVIERISSELPAYGRR